MIIIGLVFFGLFFVPSEPTISTEITKPSPSSSPSITPKEPKPSPSSSPSITPKEIKSPSESPTPTASPTPESPIQFRFAALRDLQDMRKDVNDARIGISGSGLGKFYWNLAEISFNLAQLQTLVPQEEYAVRWNQKLEILKIAVNELGAEGDELTITKAKSQLNRVLNAIPALEKIAKSLAN